MKATPAVIKALTILRDQQPDNAALFAKLMWPDSYMHTKHSNQGRGATIGKAAWLCGGSYLGRLQKAGLIKVSYTHERRIGRPVAYLTVAGDTLLDNQHKGE